MSKDNDFFDSLFDLDGDGKTTPDEEFLSFMAFNEIMKDEEEDDDDFDYDSDLDSELELDEFDSSDHFETSYSLQSVTDGKPSGQSYDSTPVQLQESQAQSMPKTLTLQEYRKRRNGLIIVALFAIIAGALFSIIPCALLWAAVKTCDDGDSASVIVFLIIGGGSLLAILFIFSVVISAISSVLNDIRKFKDIYINSLTAKETERLRKKKRSIRLGLILVVVLILVSLISIAVYSESRSLVSYKNAVSMLEQKDYKQAVELFTPLCNDGYRDSEDLLLLCNAHQEFDSGDIVDAYFTLKDVQISESSALYSQAEEFRKTVDNEYAKFKKEREAEEKRAYERKITNGVPFVGMSESRINDTSLGKPSDDVRHNYQTKDGNQYMANIYDFYKNGNKIFTARCVLGQVTEVWDYRDDPIKPRSSSGSKSYSSEPSVEGFSDPEDFYDWYWDDFFDYEDAEDYYYSHGGK